MVGCTSPCIYCKWYQTRIRYWTVICGSMWGGKALYGPHGWLQRFDATLVDFPLPFTEQFLRALSLDPWWRACGSWKQPECDGSDCTQCKHAPKVSICLIHRTVGHLLCTAKQAVWGYGGHSVQFDRMWVPFLLRYNLSENTEALRDKKTVGWVCPGDDRDGEIWFRVPTLNQCNYWYLIGRPTDLLFAVYLWCPGSDTSDTFAMATWLRCSTSYKKSQTVKSQT